MTKFEKLVLRSLAMLLSARFGTRISYHMNSEDRRHWEYQNGNAARGLVQELMDASE